MSSKKKYMWARPLFTVRCINDKGAEFLRLKSYTVIDETDTKYLIRFNSGAAHWYSKDRFTNC